MSLEIEVMDIVLIVNCLIVKKKTYVLKHYKYTGNKILFP